ncbi:moesin-like isoform X3 [Myripristis murdjan]|uniref:moesin-like isoform X3 n=1 Tax=Myripristis murdjan TaxID=586833 RepID=UPI001175F111|nr:moesin-like isoform X3 [Myripristis murdjan]
MCDVQELTCLVQPQQAAAARDTVELFERTLAAHEEQLRQLREENERQRKRLDALLQPQVRLERAVLPQQLLVIKEEVPPEQQECSPSVKQEEPEPPHIKEEQEELNITKDIPFTPAPVKSEDDEERAQSSQLHQSQTEENREAEPPASSSTETEADEEDLQASSDGQLLSSHSSEPETEHSEDDLEETGEPQSGLASLKDTLPQPAQKKLHDLKADDWIVVKDHRRKSWEERQCTGPHQVLLTTETAVKVAKKATEVHASHCKKIPQPSDDFEPDVHNLSNQLRQVTDYSW